MKKMDPKMAKMMAANMGRPQQPPMQAGPAGAGVPAMMKKGGAIKKMASGGKVGQLSKANGVASKGKTKGTFIKMAGSDKGMKKGGKC
jgi:hypothetical protein